jgi:predicted dehydrogenase
MYAICGVGKWGTKTLREFYKHVDFKYFCCRSENTAKLITKEFANIKRASLEEICKDKEVTDVIVCVPIDNLGHFALELLSYNKNIFLEKPAASSSKEIKSLIEKKKNADVYVNYKFLSHTQIIEFKNKIKHDQSTWRFDIAWEKYGSFNNDIKLNLLSHIIAILEYVFPKEKFYMEYSNLKKDSLTVRCYSKNVMGNISIQRKSKNRKFIFCLEDKNNITTKIDLNSEDLLKASIKKYLDKTNLEIGLDFSNSVISALEKIRK